MKTLAANIPIVSLIFLAIAAINASQIDALETWAGALWLIGGVFLLLALVLAIRSWRETRRHGTGPE